MAETAQAHTAYAGATTASLRGVAKRLDTRSRALVPFRKISEVQKVVGNIIHAIAPDVQVGELVALLNRDTGLQLPADMVDFAGTEALFSPIGGTPGVSPPTEVYPTRARAIGGGGAGARGARAGRDRAVHRRQTG